MTARTKILSLVALSALALTAGLWWLNRARLAPVPQTSPVVQSTGAAAPITVSSAPEPVVIRPAVTPQLTDATPVALPVPAVVATTPAVPQAPTKSATPIAESTAPAENPAEIAATARMYAAHAPLRTTEVADPDSAANKRILGTMVTKMLAQRASLPPVTEK